MRPRIIHGQPFSRGGGGIGELTDQAARQHLLVDFLDGERLLGFPGSGLGALGSLAGRPGRRFLWLRPGPPIMASQLAVELLAELPHLLGRQGLDAIYEAVEVVMRHRSILALIDFAIAAILADLATAVFGRLSPGQNHQALA
jgi:hypothetical protein